MSQTESIRYDGDSWDLASSVGATATAVATEYVPGILDFEPEKGSAMTAKAREQGLDLDIGSLVYPGPRSHVIEYLGGKGWDATGTPGDELFRRLGVPTPPERDESDNNPFGEIVYVSATLG